MRVDECCLDRPIEEQVVGIKDHTRGVTRTDFYDPAGPKTPDHAVEENGIRIRIRRVVKEVPQPMGLLGSEGQLCVVGKAFLDQCHLFGFL
jgi:hypothetical protein